MRPASLRNFTLLAATILLTALTANAAPAPSTADQVMSQAEATAHAQHKNILLDFGASWCGNCHLFEHFLSDPTIRPLMEKNFVMVTLITGEHPNDTHHANTPGAVQFEDSIGGKGAGWPYIVMLNASGHPIVDSFRPDPAAPRGDNIGYPYAPAEIDWFMHMLQLSAPNLTPQQITTIHTWLKAHGG